MPIGYLLTINIDSSILKADWLKFEAAKTNSRRKDNGNINGDRLATPPRRRVTKIVNLRSKSVRKRRWSYETVFEKDLPRQ